MGVRGVGVRGRVLEKGFWTHGQACGRTGMRRARDYVRGAAHGRARGARACARSTGAGRQAKRETGICVSTPFWLTIQTTLSAMIQATTSELLQKMARQSRKSLFILESTKSSGCQAHAT
ncbi:hypothetical protein CDL15_Pgr026978 [Punica granatum]|uniref:Uncharacterized protein n=1 Tax=Punica granatum TaxID=22663 RepID=A0A218W6D3_PUNGR|nr:hypothetical protein CDL15_Pgr026978 [Punica granatum]PKI42445.1 hypothetical protein CRG98_037176 [Punica granatum]